MIDSNRGFSLLEVLVAFVILTLVVLALFRLFSGALGNASAADEYSRALLIAESRLTLATREQPLRERQESGVDGDGRYEWTVAIAPHAATAAEEAAVPPAALRAARPGLPPGRPVQPQALLPYALWSIETTVRWPAPAGGTRSVNLATARLAPRE